MSEKRVFIIYGILAIIGLTLTIFTHPLVINENHKIIFDSSLMLSKGEIVELSLFLVVFSLIYFPAVTIYWSKKRA